jgi:hypothetical protein
MITERAIEYFEKKDADIKRRNLAIAEWLGWYQKLEGMNVWFIKHEDGKEHMIWTPMYAPNLPDDVLPFWHDMNMLNTVMEVLLNELPESYKLHEGFRKKDQWYALQYSISQRDFYCFLAKWDGENWTTPYPVDYTVGFTVGSWREGLYMFLSDIILIMLNKYDAV